MEKFTDTEHIISNILFSSKSRMDPGYYDRVTGVNGGRHSDCLIYAAGGMCSYTFTDGRTENIVKGDVLFIPKGDKYIMEIPSCGYNPVYVDFEFDSQTAKKLKSRKISFRNSDSILKLFNKLYEIWLFKPTAYKSLSLSVLYEIYAQIIRQTNESYMPKNKLLKLKEAHDYILNNYSNPELPIKVLADISRISEGHFRRLFKTIYGCPPVEYINNLRINHAKELLLCSELSVTDIAYAVGFSDVSYFSKIFKSSGLLSPNSYRKTFKNKV